MEGKKFEKKNKELGNKRKYEKRIEIQKEKYLRERNKNENKGKTS